MILTHIEAEYLPQEEGIEGIYKQIERAGRICYKSEDKINTDSAKPFVNKMVTSNHLAMLEHGTVYLKHKGIGINTHPIFTYNPYSKVVVIKTDELSEEGKPVYDLYITTNYRVLYENNALYELDYLCSPTKYHEKRVSIKCITDRGVSHELVRHRVFSFAQESTRYVGYTTRKSLSEFDCNSYDGICDAYQQGFSMREISDNSSFSESGIRWILLKNNIKLRGINNKGNRVEDYFSRIDTPEKAYLLGLIQTDGNVRKSNKNTALTITQHKDYAWYIEDMLLDFSDYIGTTKDKNCIQIQLGSKNIVNDLLNIGIVPNKTCLQTNENIDSLWNSIPIEFKGDFIRGLIDGDGYVSFFTQQKATNKSCNIGLCSAQEHLVNLIISFIKDKFNYKCGKGKDGNVYKLWITDYQKAIDIGNYLYKNFKYPFGHPKKASAWISELNNKYNIANYKDRKFIIIEPSWMYNTLPNEIFTFLKCMSDCENSYTKLRLNGFTPQQARQVLPNSIKTEIVMTGFISDWKHFFDLRLFGKTGTPHPDMVVLATKIKEQFEKVGLWEGIMKYPSKYE